MGVSHLGQRNGRVKSYVVTEIAGETGQSVNSEVFSETATLTSAAAATAVVLIPAARVGPGRKVYIDTVRIQVNGATVWATTANVFLEDTALAAFLTAAVAALTANAYVTPSTANVTRASSFALGTGGTAGEGLQIRGNANGTGSDLVVTVSGWIK